MKAGATGGLMVAGGAANDRAERLGFLGICAASVALSVWMIWRSAFRVGDHVTFNLFDDAMISMRYAHNLAGGDGLVWNAGGERVEGITNPLWTLWMAVLHLLPVHPTKVSLLVMLSGALLILGILWVVRRLVQELAPGDTVASLVSVVLTATFYPLLFWSLDGMEVGLVAFLVGVMALSALRAVRPDADAGGEVEGFGVPGSLHRRRQRAVLAAVATAAVLSRMDAVVAVVVVVAFVAWRTPAAERLRALMITAGPPAVALAVSTVGRFLYYGDWLPNTFYLKATGAPLIDRLGAGVGAFYNIMLAQLGLLVLAAAYGLYGMRNGRRPGRRASDAGSLLGWAPGLWLLAGLVAGQVAYSVWVGGDAWEVFLFTNRYLTSAVAPLMALGGVGVAGASRDVRARWVLGLLMVAVLAIRWPLLRRDRMMYFASWVTETTAVSVLAAVAALAAAIGGGALLSRRGRSSALLVAGVFTALLVVQVNAHNVVGWSHAGGEISETDAARQGWAIRQSTDPDAVLAVWLAGSEPYFADRRTVDLYGKRDRHIARLPAQDGDFRPGHTKHDLAWSLRTHRPDLVQAFVLPGFRTANTFVNSQVLEAHGYEPLGVGTLWVRTDSQKVDPDTLRQELQQLLR